MPSSTPKAGAKKAEWSLLRTLLTFAAVAWVVRSLIFTPFSIPSVSMLPTLLIGDYLVVAKWPYGYSKFSFPFRFPPVRGRILSDLPERGDIVVFRPSGNDGEDVIKRVIALPGDTIAVRGGVVALNGAALARQPVQPFEMPVSANSPCRHAPGSVLPQTERCLFPAYRETLPGGRSYTIVDQLEGGPADDFAAVRVPAGQLFLMGDNRDDSLDSRFAQVEGGIGFVPLENVVGRATAIFWSTDGTSEYWLPWTWFSALRGDRVGSGLNR